MRTSSIVVLLAALNAAVLNAQLSTLPDSTTQRIDRIFSAFTAETPGCGVGVNRDGKPAYVKTFGMANLEYGVPLTTQTVFESGSVAKQFTSAAIVLLALDGKLGLDDDVRKYIPEVPVFPGGPITIRMLLNHTSGLRDQWGLLGLMNEGPGQHVHSPETTIDLVSRQKSLNFPPGTRYLYSNTGYALAGVIVQRVSGMSLDAFSQERLFKPLGMMHTQWRDDYNEIVKNRATAYSGRGTSYRTNMPITNMIGNGGTLFTLGDMLTWMANLDNPVVGGAAWRDSLHVRGKLKNGREIPYALGLIHGTLNGTPEISHSGSTAGYQTWVGRYPERKLAVAVLCNVASANPTGLARQVAEVFIPRQPAVATQSAPAALVHNPLTPAQQQSWAGMYRDDLTDAVIRFAPQANSVAFGVPTQIVLAAESPTLLRGPTVAYELRRVGGKRRVVRMAADTATYDEVAAPDTTPRALAALVGTYRSDELESDLRMVVENGRLVMYVRPGERVPLQPVYMDGFSGGGSSLRFTRDRAGRVTGLSVFAGRVLDVRFAKVAAR
jgi:CubicO group peptidase (beta-lactamase class C family)